MHGCWPPRTRAARPRGARHYSPGALGSVKSLTPDSIVKNGPHKGESMPTRTCYLWRSAAFWSPGRVRHERRRQGHARHRARHPGRPGHGPDHGHARPARPTITRPSGTRWWDSTSRTAASPRRRRALGAGRRRQELDLLSAQGAALSQRRSGHRAGREVQPRARHVAESISSGAAALRRAVDRIEVVDDLTVRVYTKESSRSSRRAFRGPSSWKARSCEEVHRDGGRQGFRDKPVAAPVEVRPQRPR